MQLFLVFSFFGGSGFHTLDSEPPFTSIGLAQLSVALTALQKYKQMTASCIILSFPLCSYFVVPKHCEGSVTCQY